MFAGMVILVAVVVTLVRFWLPDADHYRADIERWTSSYVGLPVTLGVVHIQWRKLYPQLVIRDACLHKKSDKSSVVCIKEAHLALDVLATLKGGTPEFGDLTLVGINLSLLHRIDGSFSIIGLEDMPTDPRMQKLMQQWLVKQDYLIIKDSQLRWRDERSGQERHFIHANLGLHNKGEHHYLSGSVAMESDPATRLKIALDLQGNIFGMSDWSGNGYAEGAAVDLLQWLAGRDLAGVVVGAGNVDFKVWGVWQSARLQRVQGEARLNQLKLKNSSALSLAMQTLGGHFEWRRQAHGWRLDANRITLTHKHHSSEANNDLLNEKKPDNEMSFKVALTQEGTASIVEIGANHVRLQDGVAIMLLGNVVDDDMKAALTAMRPSAQLGNSYVRYRHDETTDKHVLVARARFDDLDFLRWKNLPGVTGLDGTLQINDQSGSLVLDTTAAQFTFGDLFRSPLSVDTLTGAVAWRHQQGMWRIQAHTLNVANTDISGSVKAIMNVPDNGGSPFVSLVADFTNGNVEHAARYLPVSIMPQDTVTWLDRALISGQVTTGQALFHGRVADFPFDAGTGRFEIRFDVSNGILDYAPDWPRLEEIEARVVFSERRMDINAVAAKSLASDVRQVHVAIADLGGSPPVLTIKGKAEGPTADVLRYVRESPLNKKIGKYFGDARAQGHSTLDLDIDLPLAATATDRIKGALVFDNSSLAVTGADVQGGVELSQVNGTLNFTESALMARDIRAMFLGQVAEIDVTTLTGQSNTFRLEARGKTNVQTLAQHFKSPLLKYFEGESNWLATLRVAETEQGAVSALLRIESPLQGMAITLPAPLNKSAMQQRELIVETAFPRTVNSSFNVKYGDFFQSVFGMNNEHVMDRGELRLGKGDGANVLLPTTPGWRITGDTPSFSVTEWLDFMDASLGAGIDSGKDAGVDVAGRGVAMPNALHVNNMDVRINALEIFGQHLKNVQIRANNGAQEWRGTIASATVTGRVDLPHAVNAPVTADFDYLEWVKEDDKPGRVDERMLDPRRIPPLRITSKRFSYYGMDLGNVSLVTSQQPTGLRMDSLKMVSDATQISAQGDWIFDKQRQPSTTISLAIDSSNLGKTFREFGFVDTFAEGRGHADLAAHWPADPAAFTFEQLQGNLHMRFKKGRLLDVNPGVGRLFGLMALNFKGLFSKGFSFDDIAGDFVITDGNAFTSNLSMDGPSAHVAVQGRVGLAAKDYDQRITVTPRSSTALPVAGMLTGGPGLGAAVFLFQKLFQSQLDQITRYQYTVKGAWNNPEFDLSSKEKEVPQTEVITESR